MRNVKLLGILVSGALLVAACGDSSAPGGNDTGGSGTGAGTNTGGNATGGDASGGGGGTTVECKDAGECDDGDACTTDSCDANVCSHAAVDPDDNDECTADSCDPATGVAHAAIDPDDNNACTVDSCDSVSGVSNDPLNPDDNNACTTDTCDPGTGISNAPIDRNDMNACTFDSCDPAIGPVNAGQVVFFSEDFSDNSAGWTLGADWAIGPALASTPTIADSADPGQDHTQQGDNGLAGVVIGGNPPTGVDGQMAYLESPAFDTTTLPMGGFLELRAWRWLNTDYTPYMVNTVEVFDGTQWVQVWTTQGISDIIIDSVVPGYGSGWFPMSFDVTPYSNAGMRVRFGFDVTNAGAYSIGGPNWDDISIVSVPYATDADQCTVATCDPVNGGAIGPYTIPADGFACTLETCDATYGIRRSLDNAACDDSNLCTNDVCDYVQGCLHNPVNFDDGNACTVDACDPIMGISHTPVMVPADGNACTLDFCDPGTGTISYPATTCTCTTAADFFFNETFANNNQGWTLGAEWQIGSATASSGQNYGNPDPAADHTATADNGVAGVVIGGNASTTVHAYQYIESPAVDLTGVSGPVFLEFWRWLNSDYDPFMMPRVEVFNGSTWVVVFQGPGNPGIRDTTWTRQDIDVSAHKNAAFRVRFGHNVNQTGAFTVSSWNVDDVRLVPANNCP